jgi:hypothetical protein
MFTGFLGTNIHCVSNIGATGDPNIVANYIAKRWREVGVHRRPSAVGGVTPWDIQSTAKHPGKQDFSLRRFQYKGYGQNTFSPFLMPSSVFQPIIRSWHRNSSFSSSFCSKRTSEIFQRNKMMSSSAARLGTLVVLVWISLCCERSDAATTLIPSAFFFNSKHSPRLSSQTSDKMPTHIFIATDPFASSMEYWLPKQHRSNVGSQIKQTYVMKPVLDKRLIEFWQTVSTVLQISLETLLGVLDVLSKNVVSPTWQEFQNFFREQVTLSTPTDAAVAVDPGDFLCEHSGWQAYFDRADTCLIYYFHRATGVSQWDPPFSNFPVPKLNPQQLAVAKQRYQHYHQSSFKSQQEPLFNSVLKGLQDVLFQNPQKPSRKPDTDEDDETPSKKPWWVSMMDDVLESTTKTTTNMVENSPLSRNMAETPSSDQKSLLTSDVVPFFAAFRDGIDVTTVKEEIQTSESSVDATNALSPLWDLFSAVVKMASAPPLSSNMTLAAASIESRVQSTPQPQQPWDFLFSFGKKPEAAAKSTVSGTILKSAKTAQQPSKKDPEKDVGKGLSNWMNDLPLFLTRDASRTIPLFGLLEKQAALVFPKKETTVSPSSPSTKTTVIQKSDQDRLKSLEDKRYAASRARQANLRRAYGTVIHDRSPTVSLTSIKLNRKKNSNSPPDWYKYLDD